MPTSLANLFSLEGRVIILTGGAGYLGRQYARALSEYGARVVIFDHNPKEEIDLSFMDSVAAYENVDVTDEKEVSKSVELVFIRFGQIDSLINNAAMNPAIGDPESEKMSGPYQSYPVRLWRKELDVNMTGMQVCTAAVAPYMMKAMRGSIVNIASEVSVIAYDWTDVYPLGKFKSPAYIASKHGVLGITQAWAAYLGEYNVRVNAFSPGGMQKEGMPADFVKKYSKKNMLGRMAREGDYNGHIIFLCSDASQHMTGHNLIADGGKSSW